MDGIIFIGIIIACIPIAVIYLLISNSGLKRRVALLEQRIAAGVMEPLERASSTPEIGAVKPKAQVTKPAAATVAATVDTAPPESVVVEDTTPKAVVVRADQFGALVKWLSQNWFYAVAAVSLALAGIFLVQYGMEQGLLPPAVRVTAALAFGVGLVGAGEYVRRHFGDSEDSSTAYLPSTFSSAGIVTLFGAVLSARLLYGFIGPEIALVGMVIVGALALVLGWFYGPLLAAVGILGAMMAPFVVGGTSEDPSWLLAYFALVASVGLAIDTLRRWAWVSVMSLTLGFLAGLIVQLGASNQTTAYFVLFCAVLAAAAIAIPVRKLVPDHSGPMLSLAYFARKKGDKWPEFPTRLAGGAVVAASALIVLAVFETSRSDEFWAGIVGLGGLVLALLIWARNAPAITDLVALPAVGLGITAVGGWRIWRDLALVAAEPEAKMPMLASMLVGIGILITVVAAWRALRGGAGHVFVAAGAALFAPALAIALEVVWQPSLVLGSYVWALHAMAIGAVMVVMAERFARADGPEDRIRMSFAVLSAMACIAFGTVILFTSAALTLALAVTVTAAAWLDRQFNLPMMGLYILTGIVAVGVRLVVIPGLEWAHTAPLAEVLLSYAGASAAFVTAWVFVRPMDRSRSVVLLESAVFSSVGLLVSLLLYRLIKHWGGSGALESHWSFGIGATVWIVLGITQLKRLEAGGKLAVVRQILGGLFLYLGLMQLGSALTLYNPVFGAFSSNVIGPRLVNTLMPAYLLPAIALAIGGWWLVRLPRQMRVAFYAGAVASTAVWLTLTIRHFWRGAEMMDVPGVSQAELYSYTIALLTIGAGLFYQSLARQSPMLRRAGLFVIGLAVAKVFLVDISGLSGLTRVFSLLFLGGALAGLAWLNRWAAGKTAQREEAVTD